MTSLSRTLNYMYITGKFFKMITKEDKKQNFYSSSFPVLIGKFLNQSSNTIELNLRKLDIQCYQTIFPVSAISFQQ